MGEIKLKPCPFCGGEPCVLCNNIDINYKSMPVCTYKVVCQCKTIMGDFVFREEAIKAWNTRYEPPTPGGAIVPAGNERLRG